VCRPRHLVALVGIRVQLLGICHVPGIDEDSKLVQPRINPSRGSLTILAPPGKPQTPRLVHQFRRNNGVASMRFSVSQKVHGLTDNVRSLYTVMLGAGTPLGGLDRQSKRERLSSGRWVVKVRSRLATYGWMGKLQLLVSYGCIMVASSNAVKSCSQPGGTNDIVSNYSPHLSMRLH
jgi:hypothetical protein